MTAKKCTKKRARAELLFCQTKPIVFLPFSLTLPWSLLPNVGLMFLGANMNHASQVMCLSGLIITPYRGIRIPESGKFGDPENFARGIRNPGLWNPEYRLRNKESH